MRVGLLQVVKVWREDLSKINAKAAESLADPAQYPNLFPNLDLALHAETYQVGLSTGIWHMSLSALGQMRVNSLTLSLACPIYAHTIVSSL